MRSITQTFIEKVILATKAIKIFSVPESEFLREKHQYMDIIGQLTEENVVMRKMIGQLKANQDPKSAVFEQELNEEAMMVEMKNLAILKK